MFCNFLWDIIIMSKLCILLTTSSYPSLRAVSESTPMRGNRVVMGVRDEIWGMSCKKRIHGGVEKIPKTL